ncbi:beta-aspartyl-peptidase, partial [Salmonella enterica subsp. enterica serovar Infantis]
GLLGGKPVVSVFHMGISIKVLQPLYDILEISDVPIGKMLPTHVNRSESLFEKALAYELKGGEIDNTTTITYPVAPAEGI